jgi:hypothetical protein
VSPREKGLIFTTEAQRTQRGVAATKSEARNPKFETNSNDQNPNDLNKFKTETQNLLNKISRNCTLVVQRILSVCREIPTNRNVPSHEFCFEILPRASICWYFDVWTRTRILLRSGYFRLSVSPDRRKNDPSPCSQCLCGDERLGWIPACAGMTKNPSVELLGKASRIGKEKL